MSKSENFPHKIPVKSRGINNKVNFVFFAEMLCLYIQLVCKCADCMTEKQGSKLLFHFVLTLKIRSISFNHMIDHKMSTVRERNTFIFNNSHYK